MQSVPLVPDCTADGHAEAPPPASGFLREPCGLCGAIAEIAPPARWGWRYDPHVGEAGIMFFPDVQPLCVRCTLGHCPDAHRPTQTRVIEDVLERKRLIGFGDDVTLFVTTSHPAAGSPDRLKRIRITQYAAFYRGAVPHGSKVPGLWYPALESGTLPFATDRPFGMLWFGWDTATEDRSAVARFTWSVNDWSREALLTIDGWSQSTAATISRLLDASEDFARKTRGRPKGVTDYALEDYERVFRLVSDRAGRRPQLQEVAAELSQHRRTVTDNLKRWGFRDYRDFAAQVMREA